MSLIKVDNLSIHFGGVRAVQDVSFGIEEGEIYSVIGPNGAGKTTLFNLITGVYKPSFGYIKYKDGEIQGKDPHVLASLGISRTFQNLQICMNMTVVENIMLGSHLRSNRNLILGAIRWPGLLKADSVFQTEAKKWLSFVGLEQYELSFADSLPYGALKKLEIARALAMNPKVLFLDEPAAGLNPKETIELTFIIKKISESGITVVLVEHDMKMVMKISDKILVLNYGKKLAEGSPEEIANNSEVISAYLGE